MPASLPGPPDDRAEPLDVSVCIATHQRAAFLAQTLEELTRQRTGDLRWEVLVVDNASTDDTQEVLRRFATRLPLVTLTEPVPGKNRALNRALAHARGALLVFTDDDVLLEADWLRELCAAAARWPDLDILGGPVIPLFPPHTPELLRELPLSAPAFARHEPHVDEGPIDQHPVGPNMAVRAQALADLRFCESIGPCGRDYPMGSETELLFRLTARGARVGHVPRARVRHIVRPEQLSEAWLLARAFRHGRGEHRARYEAGRPARLHGPRLYRRAARAWFRYLLRPLQGQRRRLEAGWEFHYLRGMVHESRRFPIREGAR